MQVKASYNNILKMALPLMFGTFVEFIVILTDGAFLSRVSGTAFNAAGIGGMLYAAFFMLGAGFSTGAQILIARRDGEQQHQTVGKLFQHTLAVMFVMSTILVLIYADLAPSLLKRTINSPELQVALKEFMQYRGLGYFSAFAYLSFVAFYAGIARTQILIYFSLLTASVNIFLDYGLIYGHFGLPEMGIAGAALASFIAETSGLAFAVIYTFTNSKLRHYCLFQWQRLSKAVIRNLVKVASPLMLQHFISVGAWFIFFNLIEQRGAIDLEASNVVRHLYFLVFIPIFGLSSVTKTFTSNLLGQGKPDEVIKAVKKIIKLNISITICSVLVLLLVPDIITGIINSDSLVMEKSASIIRWISASMIIFSITHIVFSIVPGSGDTRATLIIESTAILMYLGVTYCLAVAWPQKIEVIWLAEYVYFGLLGIISLLYLRTGKWKTFKV